MVNKFPLLNNLLKNQDNDNDDDDEEHRPLKDRFEELGLPKSSY